MGTLGAIWGIGGILLIVGHAVVKLTHPAFEAFIHDFQWYHWGLLIANSAFILYAKAYRGFQKGLSPRIAARARYLRDNPTPGRVALAPLYCLGYFHIVRRKQFSIIAITMSMVALILLVRMLGQPWRGIIALGIVAGLAWGFITILFYTVRALTSKESDHLPLVPDD